MIATGPSDHVSHVSLQMPHLTRECLHFILEGTRAGDGGADATQIRDASRLLTVVKSLRSALHTIPPSEDSAPARDTVEQLDYGLKDIQSELRTAIRRMAAARH